MFSASNELKDPARRRRRRGGDHDNSDGDGDGDDDDDGDDDGDDVHDGTGIENLMASLPLKMNSQLG